MKKSVRLAVATIVVSIGLAVPASSAFGNTGYEGQPGNQSANHGGHGPTGYEGNPGNQGG
jgi:hypothetical protein